MARRQTVDSDQGRVSCRNLGWVFDVCAERGVDPDRILAGVPFPQEHFVDPSRFIDWESFSRFCSNVGEIFSEHEIVEHSRACSRRPFYRILSIPARLIYSVEEIFYAAAGPAGILPRLYPCETSILKPEPNRLLIDVRMKPPFEPSHVFHLCLLGQTIELPVLQGLPPAEVAMTSTPRGVRFDVRYPSGGGLLAPLRRALSWPFTARMAAREFVETDRILEEKYRDLEAEVAERERAQAAVRESEARYRLFAEHVHDVLWTADLGLRYTWVSPSVEEMFGYTIEEAMGLSPADDLTPEASHAVQEVLREEIAADAEGADPDRSRTLELEAIHKDGSPLPVEVNVRFLRDEEGRPVGLVGVTRDISERKRAEEQLRQAQKLESIGHLAGGVAHDFNNLLVAILGNAELARGHADLAEEVEPYLDEIQEAAERAAGLTRQLLAFGRRQIVEPVPIDLNQLIEGLGRMLNRLIPENIENEFLPGEDLDAILADRGQLEQVIVNLAVNARDAMPEGGKLVLETANVTIPSDEADPQPPAEPGRYVLLRVIDSGRGMTKEVRERIFEPFFSTKPEGQGTGLGLSVVFGIVKHHGGFLDVFSEPGRGAEFRVYLPAEEREPAHPEPAPAGRERGGCESVLLVEDEPSARRLARRVLSKAGYEVIEARDGREAVEAYRRHRWKIDLVLLDVVMPKMMGSEVRRRIREIDSDVRILFSSGYSRAGGHLDFIAREGLDLISKPYPTKALLEKIREILDR
jgi:PAS domain S-box-containing protein